jgi:hypothetical protein
MHGALLEYSSPYRTVFTSYGMFSTPLRRCGRGRENGLVAIQARRRNARPPPPRLASPRFSSPRGVQVIEDEERCAAASWLRFLRIQQMHSYQVPSAHTPYRPAAQNGSSRCGPGQCSTLSRPPVESGFWIVAVQHLRPRKGILQAGSCSSRSLCNPGSSWQVARQPAPHHCTTFAFWTESRIPQ